MNKYNFRYEFHKSLHYKIFKERLFYIKKGGVIMEIKCPTCGYTIKDNKNLKCPRCNASLADFFKCSGACKKCDLKKECKK